MGKCRERRGERGAGISQQRWSEGAEVSLVGGWRVIRTSQFSYVNITWQHNVWEGQWHLIFRDWVSSCFTDYLNPLPVYMYIFEQFLIYSIYVKALLLVYLKYLMIKRTCGHQQKFHSADTMQTGIFFNSFTKEQRGRVKSPKQMLHCGKYFWYYLIQDNI